ncbi:hypothetical protein EYF80_006924 [Liparis tanakae]|uniref:Uncharacterized protein n=1 Tax=Liparis tanakae TaxID=230148 RepID=A0A4Z2IYY4_9TELE|nr:hypothetical protein EYF80_006924 [Liparis tanakae]
MEDEAGSQKKSSEMTCRGAFGHKALLLPACNAAADETRHQTESRTGSQRGPAKQTHFSSPALYKRDLWPEEPHSLWLD